MGLAPDNDDNGPSFMTSMRNISLIDKLQISVRMDSSNKGGSRITFGGYDQSSMLPFPTASNPDFYWYDNKYDDKEWGLEIRNIMIGSGNYTLDSGYLTYAKIDSFTPFIQLPFDNFVMFSNYMKSNHTEMQCLDQMVGFGICRVTG